MKNYKKMIENMIKSFFSSVYLILLLCMLIVSIVYPKSYNVRDYGAVSDSTQLSTKAIQEAVDECNYNGGGRVIVLAGTYLTGTIIKR